ncbi:MAG: hypothetical protein V1647_00660 [Pseudomonadota bacterium]
MTDTDKKTEKLYRKMLLALSGEERMEMCFSMLNSAKKIIISSLPVNLTPKEVKRELFLRLYGSDFNEDEKKKIIQHITAA